MSWVTVIFSMTASACLTLAFIYGFIWWRQKNSWANLLFALAALGTAASAGFDLALLRAESPAQMAAVIRWSHLPIWVIILALAGFVRFYLRAGRGWLLWAVCGLRSAALILNFLTGQNLNYREILSVNHIPFLGETVSTLGEGAPNPWMFVGQLGLWGLVIFVTDAAITVWRRGDRRMSLIVGGSIVFFFLAGTAQTELIVWGHLQWPPTSSLFYLGIIAVMGYEVSGDALRAVQLGRDLRAKDQQITIAAEAANMGFWFRDFAREDFWASKQWRTLFGFTTSETLYIDNFLQRLHPNDREPTRQALENAYQGDGSYQTEHRVLLPDGQERWIACQGRVEFNSDRQPLRLQGVSLDITRRKVAELEAQAHRNEVAHLLRVASLGELSSALAHELSQPLTAILGNAEAARLFIAGNKFDPQELDEILSDIVADDKRAGEVVGRLRTLLKKGNFQLQPLQANDLVHEVLKLLRHDLAAHAVRVVTDLSADLPIIRGDRVQLEQVLINLILNASDAMSQVAENARALTIRSRTVENNVVEISVYDSGTGIPPGNEEQIFEAYHTTKPLGLGLGLSLSRSIALAHGGRLWAENKSTQGAVFHFTIPAEKDDPR
jgi:two-component system sensor kinase FixL